MSLSRRHFIERASVLSLSLTPIAGAILSSGCGGTSDYQKELNTIGKKADDLLTRYAAGLPASAISAAIVRVDSLIWSKSIGTANKALNTKATNDTAFLIASISKTVTAVAAMQLVETGKLDLDRDINTYLDFKIVSPKQPTAIITLRHLLTHTSGITDDYYSQVAEPALYYKDIDPSVSLRDICRAFFLTGGQYFNTMTFAATAPGTQFSYSNIGIMLVGYLVERAAGFDFAVYCRERIFRPLGMTKTSWRVADFSPRDLAMPYDGEGLPLGNYTFADYPDGALRTTVKDLSQFLRAFILKGSFNGQTILKSTSVDEMRRVQFPKLTGAETQGLVWAGTGDAFPNLSLVGHAGAEQGVSTGMFFDPDTGVGAIFFQNRLAQTEEEQTAAVTLFSDLIRAGQGK
jgi:CubicO group peptidase (beta-lactamase class C family)